MQDRVTEIGSGGSQELVDKEAFEEDAAYRGRYFAAELESKGFKPDQIESVLDSTKRWLSGDPNQPDTPAHATVSGANMHRNSRVMNKVNEWIARAVTSGRSHNR